MSVYSARTKSATPSSILKKSTSLKTRLSQITSTPSKVRFVLPHSRKVRSILKDYTKRGIVKDYESLICMIRDSILTDDDISSLLKEATACISLLNKDLRLFVEALLSISWTDKSQSVISEYQSFIVNLVSAHNYHAELVVNKLVSLFIPPLTDADWTNGIPSQEDCIKCQYVHSICNVLLKVVPMCKDLFLHSLIVQFPYMKKSTHVHEYYLQNVLWVLSYEPSLRPDILHLVFSKLIIMDVNCPREEIERLHSENDEEVFMMDEDKRLANRQSIEALAHTLDICLNKIFNYFITECHNNPVTREFNWENSKGLYHHILMIFDKIILPTYNTHHVQFVMFVLCSFKTTLSEGFLNYLWKKVCNPSEPSVIRQSAVNYIVSFIARASFVPMSMMKGTLQEMAAWIHSYIATQDGLECVNSDVRVHSVFYTVCQALFYVVAFRHSDLVKSRKNMVFVESLNMAKIVTSRLNPLRVCQPAVVQKFAAVTRKYQLAYCYSVIEHNARNIMPVIHQDERGSQVVSNNILEAFYPFDPYVLKISGEKIYPYYQDYTEVNFEANEVDMREVDTDDFLEHELPGVKSQFSYGSSPGFMFKS